MDTFKFTNDYSEGCHPKILKRLLETNLEQSPGYGTDAYSYEAKERLREVFACPEHEVVFFTGGTPLNLTVMAAFLKPWQGVLAASTGHIAVHEAGAIEATGHKVLELSGKEGKLSASSVRSWCKNFYADETHDHMVAPGMIYISQPTELGTLYTKDELLALKEVAREFSLPIFMDGARLAMALAAEDMTGLSPCDYKELVDLFSVGGTKCGALFGEALMISPEMDTKGFLSVQKQRVGRLAKGRLLALQFLELFNDELYLALGEAANQRAKLLQDEILEMGYRFQVKSPTNQLFLILNDEIIDELKEPFGFEVQTALSDNRHVVRLVTSWATSEDAVAALLQALKEQALLHGIFSELKA